MRHVGVPDQGDDGSSGVDHCNRANLLGGGVAPRVGNVESDVVIAYGGIVETVARHDYGSGQVAVQGIYGGGSGIGIGGGRLVGY